MTPERRHVGAIIGEHETHQPRPFRAACGVAWSTGAVGWRLGSVGRIGRSYG